MYISGLRLRRQAAAVHAHDRATVVRNRLRRRRPTAHAVGLVTLVGLVGVATSAAPSIGAPATIVSRSATTAQNGVSASLAVAVPATVQNGDVLVASVTVQYRPTIGTPPGWTLVRKDVSSTGPQLEQALYVRVAGAAEPPSYSWSLSSSHAAVGGIVDYTGVDQAAPVEASAGTVTTNKLSIVAPSVTTTAPNALRLAVFGVQAGHSIALPANLNREYAAGATAVAGEKLNVVAGDQTVASPGPSGTVAAPVTQASTGIGESIALNPASGAPNGPPVVDSVSVLPGSPLTNDVVSAVVAAHDPDGDPVTFAYQWVVNGVDLVGATSSSLDLSRAGNGSRGDVLAVRVTASDGKALSVPVTSPSVTVGDSAPSVSVGLSPASPLPSDVVSAVAGVADADGDAVSLTYVWSVNGVVVRSVVTGALSDSLDLSSACGCVAGDRVAVQVTPNDGTLDGSPAGAAATVSSPSTFGVLTETAIPGSATPSNLAPGPDGNMWYTEEKLPNVGRVTPGARTTTLFPVSSPSTAFNGITGGPDGGVWFVDGGASRVGRVDPATGAVTEFPMPTAGAGGGGITVGGDGNLWFAESAASKIGRITTSGTITEFKTRTASSWPHSIVAGSDGNLWFTEFNANKIGRITTAGVVTEFPLPTAAAGAAVIAAGPDGNLWFCEQKAGKIGRITTAGVVTEFALPTTGAFPIGIAAGSDGNLWFAERTADKLGRITVAGVITEFPLPTGTGPDKVAAGPDGNIWFTEHTTDRIASFSLH